MAIELREAFAARIELTAPLTAGAIPGGTRRIIPIAGGRFTGRLAGDVLPVGADFNLMRDDGIGFLSVRYMVQADDGAIICILNEGWFRSDDGAIERLVAGDASGVARWYCRCHPRFEAPAGPHAWLNRTVFVAEMAPLRALDYIELTFHELL